MAHSEDYSKIYNPSGTADGLSLEEIRRCVGEGHADLGKICRDSTKINKWAKYKPVNQEVLGVLTEQEREGTGADKTAGYYYGVKMASEVANLISLESVDFSYGRRPTGGMTSPFRLLDFSKVNSEGETIGYNHKATPTLFGRVEGMYYNVDKCIDVYLTVDSSGWNVDGIDIGAIIGRQITGRDVTRQEAMTALGNMYPCIMIKNESTGYTYARALKEARTGAYARLYSNDAWRDYWYIEDMTTDTSLWGKLIQNGANSIKAYVFLVSALGGTSTIDLDNWVEVGSGKAINAFAVPEATGTALTLNYHYSGYVPSIAMGELNLATTTSFNVSVGITPEVASGASTVVELYAEGVKVGEQTVSGGLSGASFTVTWSAVGITPITGTNQPVSLEAKCGTNTSGIKTITYRVQ